MKAAISNSASKADWQSSACAGTGVKRWQQWDPACNGCGLRGHHYSIAKDFDTSKISETALVFDYRSTTMVDELIEALKGKVIAGALD